MGGGNATNVVDEREQMRMSLLDNKIRALAQLLLQSIENAQREIEQRKGVIRGCHGELYKLQQICSHPDVKLESFQDCAEMKERNICQVCRAEVRGAVTR